MSLCNWLQRRERGVRPTFGDQDFIMKRVYQSLAPYHHWHDVAPVSEYGSVFNLEFSPEGNILVAACEKKSILLFDATTTKQMNTITDAHMDNVNCIKFLNDRMFATCSDDTTVALWDLRFLKMKVRSLNGHTNWVKNIEYSNKESLLLTSSFDGSIFTWDINSHTEQGLLHQKVFHTSGLMRSRITPDGSKLVICTTGGYLMIIHDLDLSTLHKDLSGFRPSIYRLMQMGHQYIPQAAKFDHVFSKKQKKNRVELVTDFPEGNDAEVILSLQIHPKGHSFLSRNISYDELTEWSCVHDINEEQCDLTDKVVVDSKVRRKRKCPSEGAGERPNVEVNDGGEVRVPPEDPPIHVNRRQRSLRPRFSGSGRTVPRLPALVPSPFPTSGSGQQAGRPESFVPDIWAAEVTVHERTIRQRRARTSNSVIGYNFVYAINSGVLSAAAASGVQTTSNSNPIDIDTNVRRMSWNRVPYFESRRSRARLENRAASAANRERSAASSRETESQPPSDRADRNPLTTPLRGNSSTRDHQIFQNAKKLMFYMQESNKANGVIKEPCFSADGRIISSPFDSGVRLLGFNDDCSEYPHYQTADNGKCSPQPLVELKKISAHDDVVLSTKFSPREPLLATGCRSGKIVWYRTNL